eukprot:scaffold22952_cov30-Tisochrysis_lutea.AAC.2
MRAQAANCEGGGQAFAAMNQRCAAQPELPRASRLVAVHRPSASLLGTLPPSLLSGSGNLWVRSFERKPAGGRAWRVNTFCAGERGAELRMAVSYREAWGVMSSLWSTGNGGFRLRQYLSSQILSCHYKQRAKSQSIEPGGSPPFLQSFLSASRPLLRLKREEQFW